MAQRDEQQGSRPISGGGVEMVDRDLLLQPGLRDGSSWLDLRKRAIDLLGAAIGLLVTAPVLLVCGFMVWRQDGHAPVYMAERVGRGGQLFRMVKLRSMRVGADRSGVTATSVDDPRITPLGHFLRRYKLDELPQLWNVLKGEMSFVGPRPQVLKDVQAYTREERRLLGVSPGITDLASIVFADEADVLGGHDDPQAACDLLVRPWKSRLGLLYVEKRSLMLDAQIVWLTALQFLSRRAALAGVARVIRRHGAPPDLCRVVLREDPLRPHLPPGLEQAG
jgi:lipopolysaccharide/colanic/teichoic acid biosynthesis glycosyltransferase